jgi:ATP-dependent Zn protease
LFYQIVVKDGFFSPIISGENSDKLEKIEMSNINFADVGGLNEAKEELEEIVNYFKDPEKFLKKGIKLPRGILLSGSPGNGKTLLAKALAGECKVPFIFKPGSSFEEVFVGLGARRVRELFEVARSYKQGCIIFIDEIDSIGKNRYG